MLAPLLLVALLPLSGCQTTSAASSSIIEETSDGTEAAVCGDLQPETISTEEFDFTGEIWDQIREAVGDTEVDKVGLVDEGSQWVRDWFVQNATAYKSRCGSN